MSETIVPATLLCDFYKISHRSQYPDKTEVVYSTWTPRSNKHYPFVDKVIQFSNQGFIKKILVDYFDKHFFSRSKVNVLVEYERYLKFCLFVPDPDSSHIADLHDLGYLPILIKALPEGTRVPFRVPMMTVQNTDPRFFWVTNYLETILSSESWQGPTSATIADRYKQILNKWAMKTVGNLDFVPFQGHDFSMRGMNLDAAMVSGAGHLLSFVGTDTIPAIAYHEAYYGANIEQELVGCSVPATEHSVMMAGGQADEYETYRRLIQDIYPTGIISIVSDTWDLWHVVTDTLPKLRDVIMARDGGPESMDKVVIRPDSGDPADIICGVSSRLNQCHGEVALEYNNTPEGKGLVELLWDIFGGTVNELGYKELNPCIGAIYGDSITPERAEDICSRLAAKGFASTNVVFGIGSYTYQFNTRDTFGFAMKSTCVVVDGVERAIFKDPKTDDGTKKSNKGVVAVQEVQGELVCIDELPLDNDEPDLMQVVFRDGVMLNGATLAEIRERIAS